MDEVDPESETLLDLLVQWEELRRQGKTVQRRLGGMLLSRGSREVQGRLQAPSARRNSIALSIHARWSNPMSR
jgi:hypothetical protein